MGCTQISDKSDRNRQRNPSSQPPSNIIDPQKFRSEALERHNYYRSLHHSEPLTLSSELTKYAQDFATEMANRNKEDHSDCVLNGKNLRENVYSNEKYFTGKEMTDEFYREIVNYDFTKGECEPQAARFTQLVWKETKEVGFGIAKNEQTGKIFAVANYYPNGNGLGQFKDNVISK